MNTVVIPLAKGFEEIETVTLIDVLRRGGFNVIGAGVGSKEIEGAHKITVKTDEMIDEILSDDIDMIVLPGGWGGTRALAENQKVQSLLKEMKKKDKHIGAICAAPFALKAAGVLPEKFTCYPGAADEIGKTPGYTDSEMVVQDGKVITSRGPGTAICFGIKIVELLKDKEQADVLRRGLLVEGFCK